RPDVSADHGSEQPAPLADATLGQGEHAEDLAAGEDPEVLPDVEKASADEADHDHPGEAVARVLEVGHVLAQQPEAEPRGGEDAQHGEDAVPRDEQRTDARDVRVEVDDDCEEAHDAAAARCSRCSATSLGSSAKV